MRRRLVALCPILCLCLAYCGEARTFSIMDSAGVRIAENELDAGAAGRSRITLPDPKRRIGESAGDTAFQFHRIVGAVRLTDGRIAVLNAGSSSVRFFSDDGRFLYSVGRRGQGPGEFRNPTAICRYPGDSILVINGGTYAPSELFSSDGSFSRRVEFTAPSSFVDSCASDGSLLTFETLRGFVPRPGIWRDSTPFSWVNSNGGPGSPLGRFAIQELHETRIDGQTGRSDVPFGINAEFEAGGEHAFIGSNEAYEIGVYGLTGRLERIVRLKTPPRALSADLERQHRDSTDAFLSRAAARRTEVTSQNTLPVPYPRSLPFYSAVRVGPGGELWVKRYHPWEAGFRFAGERPVAEWDVFDPQGRWVLLVEVPYALTVFEVGTDYLLGRWRDEADVEFIHLYGLAPR